MKNNKENNSFNKIILENSFIKSIYNESIMLVVALFLFVCSAIFVPYFFSTRNLIGLALSVSQIGMVASTMMLCLASTDFDLSVGSQIALAGVIAVVILNATGSIFLALFLTVLIGALLGFFNGFSIAQLGINAFIATLSTMQIYRGLAYIISNGKSISASNSSFFVIATSSLFGIPMPIYITFITFIIFGFILKYTVYGRNVLAVGSNKIAAHLSGVNVKKIRIMNFTLQGLVASLAGFILASRLTSAQPTVAQGFELQVISACILGGVSLYGGKATMLGVIAGVFIMGIVQDVMNLVNLPVFYQYLVTGMLLMLAVGFDQLKEKKAKK